ncbi:MAG: hypothetical protein QGG53_45880, partial [Planctomycetota bacterium]|nr:hypothetical protein [Planctomycetota bacterium]
DYALEGGTIDAGAGKVEIRSTDNAGREFDLGANTDAQANTIELSDAELDTVTASNLRIGGNVAGSFNITSPISPANVTNLGLVSNSSVTQTPGSTITVANLALSTSSATLVEGNNVTRIAAIMSGFGQDLNFKTIGALEIGTVDSVSGISTNSGNANLQVDGNLTQSNPVFANLGIRSTSGDVTLTNASNQVNSISGRLSGNGNSFSFINSAGVAITGVGPVGGIETSNGDITVTANGDVFVNDSRTDPDNEINAGSGRVTIHVTSANGLLETDDTPSDGTNILGANIDLIADRMELDSVNISATNVLLRPNTTNVDISIGGADAVGMLGLTDTELDTITTTGELIVDGNLTNSDVSLTSAVNLANTSTITILSGGTITDSGNTTVFTDTNLGLIAGTGIGSLANPINISVSQLSASTGSGDIHINNNGNVTVGSVGGQDGVETGGSNVSLVSDGDITIAKDVTAAANGDILIQAAGDIAIQANIVDQNHNDDVAVVAGGVIITDGNGEVQGSSVLLIGTAGVGGANSPIQVDADTLAGTTSATSSGFNVLESNNVTIGSVTSSLTGLNATGVSTTGNSGNIEIATDVGSMVVDSPISANGTGFVSLLVEGGGSDLTINQTVSTGGGNIDISGAQGDGSLFTISSPNGLLSSQNGDIIIAADEMTFSNATSISAGSGSVILTAVSPGRNIEVGTVAAGNLSLLDSELDRIVTTNVLIIGDANAGTVQFSNGDIQANNVADLTVVSGAQILTSAAARLIEDDTLTLDAATGISGNSGVTADKFAVDASSSSLAARTRTSGDIRIQELDNLATGTSNGLESNFSGIQTAANGDIELEVRGGSFTVNQAITADGSGDVNIDSTGQAITNTAAISSSTGDITVTFGNNDGNVTNQAFQLSLVSTNVGDAGGNVTFNMADSIFDSNGASTNIQANVLTFNDQSGGSAIIGSGSSLEIVANTINATNVGQFDIVTTGDVSLGAITTVNGGINVQTNGNVSFTGTVSVADGQDVDVDSLSIDFQNSLNVSNATITLQAGEIDFTGGASSITGPNSSLVFQAQNSGDNINVGGNTTTGDLDLTDTDLAAIGDGFASITIGQSSGSGNLTITGAATVSDPTTFLMASGGKIKVNAQITGAGDASLTFHGVLDTTILNADVVTEGNTITFSDSVEVQGVRTVDSTSGGNFSGAKIDFQSDLDADSVTTGSLVVNAGTGNVEFDDNVGGTTPLTALNVTSQGTTTFSRNTDVGALTVNTGTLNYGTSDIDADSLSLTFSSLVRTSGKIGITTSGGVAQFDTGGSLTFGTSANEIEFGGTFGNAALSANADTVAFEDQALTGDNALHTIAVAGTNGVTISVNLESGTGNIDIASSGGNISGGTSDLEAQGAISLSANDITIGSLTGRGVNVSATGSLTMASTIDGGNQDVSISSTTFDATSGGLTIQNAGNVSIGNTGTLSVSGGDFVMNNIGGDVSFTGGGTVVVENDDLLVSTTNGSVSLGNSFLRAENIQFLIDRGGISQGLFGSLGVTADGGQVIIQQFNSLNIGSNVKLGGNTSFIRLSATSDMLLSFFGTQRLSNALALDEIIAVGGTGVTVNGMLLSDRSLQLTASAGAINAHVNPLIAARNVQLATQSQGTDSDIIAGTIQGDGVNLLANDTITLARTIDALGGDVTIVGNRLIGRNGLEIRHANQVSNNAQIQLLRGTFTINGVDQNTNTSLSVADSRNGITADLATVVERALQDVETAVQVLPEEVIDETIRILVDIDRLRSLADRLEERPADFDLLIGEDEWLVEAVRMIELTRESFSAAGKADLASQVFLELYCSGIKESHPKTYELLKKLAEEEIQKKKAK